MIQRPDDALRRIDLLKLAERLGQREQAAAYLVDAPFEQGAQQLLLFDVREPYEMGCTSSTLPHFGDGGTIVANVAKPLCHTDCLAR